MIPYITKIAADYLRAHPDVEDLGARVVSNAPDRTDTPWVRVRKLDGANSPNSPVEHLIGYLVQFDCYAGKDGGAPEAELLGRTVRAALAVMPEVGHEAVVTSTRIVGDTTLPDTDLEPARDRVILTARIHAHS